MPRKRSDKKSLRLKRIVSGGQTGVDRAALDAAIALGIPHGGWCPRGRLAEDGIIAGHYQLSETESSDYAVRTEQNVLDSEATLILHYGAFGGGTELTRRLARRHGRPCLLVDLQAPPDLSTVRRWLTEHRVKVLNIAGPRESQRPGIAAMATDFLEGLLATR